MKSEKAKKKYFVLANGKGKRRISLSLSLFLFLFLELQRKNILQIPGLKKVYSLIHHKAQTI